MEHDTMHLASAPEPSAGPVPVVDASPASHTDEPEHTPAGADVPRRRLRAVAIVVAIVLFDLLVAVGIGAYLLVTAPAGTGLPIEVEYALRARVLRAYPDYTVSGVEAISREGTATTTGVREVAVFFTLQSVKHPGFVLSQLYIARQSEADDASAYTNLDDFFTVGAVPAQPTDSFMDMWVHQRPGQECIFVTETGSALDATRTYLVVYEWQERRGEAVETMQGRYDYAYVPATGAWTGKPAAPPEPLPFTSEEPNVPWSLDDTATAVAEGLPGFEPFGTTGDASNEVMLLVKHRRYPGLRMAVYPIWLDPPDATDGMVALFGGDRKKANAFAKAWSALHGGTVIDLLMMDPDEMEDPNLVYVTYVESIAGVGDTSAESSTQLRYDTRKRTWSVYEPAGWND